MSQTDQTPALTEALSRMVDHFGTWANDHAVEATTETWAALHCAKEVLAQARLAVPAPTDQRVRDWAAMEVIYEGHPDPERRRAILTFEFVGDQASVKANQLQDAILALSSSVAITEGDVEDYVGTLVVWNDGTEHFRRKGEVFPPTAQGYSWQRLYATPTQPAGEKCHQRDLVEVVREELLRQYGSGEADANQNRAQVTWLEGYFDFGQVRTAIAAHKGKSE